MATRISTPLPAAATLDQVQTLTESDIDHLRLGWRARIEAEEVRRALFTYPGRSVWLPETLEFAVVAPWRHRHEIAHIQALSAVRHARLLVDAVAARCEELGAALLLIAEFDEERRPAFYEGAQLDLLEEVITYELDRLPPYRAVTGQTRFVLADPADEATRHALLEIDHAAFPWLWWNNDLEFRTYALTPGVELYLGLNGDMPVAYIGITTYIGWGHLDRIAVLPARQGEGIGQEALAFAVERLARRGARRIGLSTQRSNHRSRRLYERAGFRRSHVNDYRVYGRTLRAMSELGVQPLVRASRDRSALSEER